ncbi:hypothetical protein GGD83_004290 [Rhodoblastus sphagnicola]|nr:hypothetical protein [Rhodoblastus sphagnicola]
MGVLPHHHHARTKLSEEDDFSHGLLYPDSWMNRF